MSRLKHNLNIVAVQMKHARKIPISNMILFEKNFIQENLQLLKLDVERRSSELKRHGNSF